MTYSRPFKFIIVGVVNTIVGTAIMFGLYNVLGCSYWNSSVSNYVFTSILSYILNRRFTFEYQGGLAISGVRFAVNIFVCYIIAYGVAKQFVQLLFFMNDIHMQENIAMLVGMCIFTVLNYIGQRKFVFREGKMEHREIYKKWLNSDLLTVTEKQELKMMTDDEVYEAFYKYAEFGTAGMREVMGLGTNRLNIYTIRMASKGFAELLGKGSKVVVAYDTRNNSVEFAKETAKVLAAAGIKVYLFDRYSPVPLLSYAVRALRCDGGVVITASHNTKEYNGFKVYDNTGSQMNEKMAKDIAENIKKLDGGLDIDIVDINHSNIEYVGDDVVAGFLEAVDTCSLPIEKKVAEDIKIVYTPLHGSGRDFVIRSLKKAGFSNLILVEEQETFDGGFPTVSKPNPEDKAAFSIAEGVAIDSGADIIIGTDPDCDRIGIGVIDQGMVTYLSGNQTGVLLIDFIARKKDSSGKKMVTTIVTSDMGRVVAESKGIDVIRTFTGFKNIGAEMNKMSSGEFFMGYEESYGYLPGEHARDKDGVSSALVICEMAAYWKAQGKLLTDVLADLYDEYGYWIDQQQSFTFEGSAGVEKITEIMDKFRTQGVDIFEGITDVEELLDYSTGIAGFPPANVLKYIFSDGSWLAVRPSGTEPKIKFYYCITASSREGATQMYDSLKSAVENIVDK